MALAVGCAAPMNTFLHPEADLSYYTRVGVVPFRSLASDRLAGEKVTSEFSTAVLASELFEVIDYGVFVNVLAEVTGSRAADGGLNAEQLKRIGESAQVQGVFMGTVRQFDMVSTPSGRFPVVSLEIRLLDVATDAKNLQEIGIQAGMTGELR
jgi:hypothetical protein